MALKEFCSIQTVYIHHIPKEYNHLTNLIMYDDVGNSTMVFIYHFTIEYYGDQISRTK